MSTPSSKPNPLHGQPTSTFAPTSKVDLPHMPALPEQPAVHEEKIDEDVLIDSTKEELTAGRIANDLWSKRAEAEHEAGRKAVERNTARAKKNTPESITKE